MRWSKVRKLVEDSFAESVRGRVTVHATKYASGRYTQRAWIAVDGAEVANFACSTCFWGHPEILERHPDLLAERGEFCSCDLRSACWTILHSSPHAWLSSSRPLVRSLAVLNSKVGKNRLKALAEADDLHR